MRRAERVYRSSRATHAAGLLLAAFVSAPAPAAAQVPVRRARPRPRSSPRPPDSTSRSTRRSRWRSSTTSRSPSSGSTRRPTTSPIAGVRALYRPVLTSVVGQNNVDPAPDQPARRHAGGAERSDDVQRRRLAALPWGGGDFDGRLQQPATGLDEQLQHLQPAVQLDVLGAVRPAAAAQLPHRRRRGRSCASRRSTAT